MGTLNFSAVFFAFVAGGLVVYFNKARIARTVDARMQPYIVKIADAVLARISQKLQTTSHLDELADAVLARIQQKQQAGGSGSTGRKPKAPRSTSQG